MGNNPLKQLERIASKEAVIEFIRSLPDNTEVVILSRQDDPESEKPEGEKDEIINFHVLGDMSVATAFWVVHKYARWLQDKMM